MKNYRGRLWLLVAACLLLFSCREAAAYVEAVYTLGKITNESSNVLVLRVEKVDKQKNTIIYRKVADLKGTQPGDTVKHFIGQNGFHPRESQNIMAWAEVGKTAVFFHNRTAGEVCIDNYWYQVYGGEWWNMSHAEPYLLRSYAGKPERLATAMKAILAGQEVVVPCMSDGDKNALQLRNGRMQRMKASLKIQDYNIKKDLVEGGGDEMELRPLAGMPGFTHQLALGRTGPGAGGVAPGDFNGDGKPDLCLFGLNRVSVLQNVGGSFDEVPLPLEGGARAAAWADFDGDGKLELLLATPAGPRLFHYNGKQFDDITAALPEQGYYNLTAAAWIDYDGDGKPDILLADGFRGLRLYRNKGAGDFAAKGPSLVVPRLFDDVSDAVGLGSSGVGGRLKGDHLAVADVDGDGRPDILFSAGRGLLLLNTPQGFVEAKNCGISYQAGKVAPVFGDYPGDGRPDLFVPQRDGCKLFRNAGGGRFTDVTAQAGDLGRAIGDARCAAWADFGKRGRPDLVVGRFRGPNRYLRNNGDGTFTDASEQIGLRQRIYNTSGIAVIDLNNDKTPDLVMNNEGQDATMLVGSATWPGEVLAAAMTFRSEAPANTTRSEAPASERTSPKLPLRGSANEAGASRCSAPKPELGNQETARTRS